MTLYTVNDVAKTLKLSRSKIYSFVEQGVLAHHRFGGAIRISEQQLAEFLEECKCERDESSPKRRRKQPPKREWF